jgi:hypothetical protein
MIQRDGHPTPSGALIRFLSDLYGADGAQTESRGVWLIRYVLLAILLAIVLFCRRPDSLLIPQFWGEDGVIFFREQILLGFWGALAKQYNGFPYFACRFSALLGAVVPPATVPLAYSVIAMTVTALAIATFSLPGFRHLVRSDATRAIACIAMVCIPTGSDVLVTMLNIGWWLAALLIFLSVMRTPRSRIATFVWCLGTPAVVFSAPLAPIVAPLWALRALYGAATHRRRDLAFGLIQLTALLLLYFVAGSLGAGDFLKPDGSPAFKQSNGAIFAWDASYVWPALRILPYVITWSINAAVLPTTIFAQLRNASLPVFVLPAVLFAACVAVGFAGLARRGRITVCLATYLFVSALCLTLLGRHNVVRDFEVPPTNRLPLASRYEVIPPLALVLGAAGMIDAARRRRTGIVIVTTALAVVWAAQFRLPPFVNNDWPLWADRLERKLASGSTERLAIPINPAPWKIIFDSSTAGQ